MRSPVSKLVVSSLAAALVGLAGGCNPISSVVLGGKGGKDDDSATDSAADTGGADSGGDSGDSAPDSGDSGPTDPLPALCINEILPGNIFTTTDGAGLHPDLIELYNSSDADISLAGFTITDDLEEPAKHVLAAALVVPSEGWLVLVADGATEEGTEHLSFSLDRSGESLGLYTPDGRAIDTLSVDRQEVDWSAARVPDGSVSWVAGALPTFGATNGAGDSAGDSLADSPGGPLEAVPAVADLTEAFYDDDVVVPVDLTLSRSARRSLEFDPYTWVEGDITVDGRTYGPVGVRVKGENSYLPFSQKSSLKIKMDKYVVDGVFLGMAELTFNNMYNDYSMMHERVAYKLYREAGVPAARANYAWLSVNEEPYGLFTNLETVNKDLIKRWFADADGSLFEVHDVDFKDEYISSFSLEYGPDDRTNLQAVADAMEESPSRAMRDVAAALDVESYLRYWAVSMVVGQFDSYPYGVPGDDCHVYDDPTDGVLKFLPHGLDETFYYPTNDLKSVYGVLSTTCLDVESCEVVLDILAWDAQDTAERIDLYNYALTVQAQGASYIAADPNKPYSQTDIETYQTVMLDFIAGRADVLTDQIGAHP